MYEMMDKVEVHEAQLKELYHNIGIHTAPSQEIRKKVDACSAVTADLLQLMGANY